MLKQIFILSLIFIFSAGLFAGDTGRQKKNQKTSAAAGKTHKSGNPNTEAASDGVSFVNANGDTLLQVRADGIVKADTLVADSVNVDGTVTATAFVGDGSGLTGLPANPWSLNGSNAYYNNGNVGIGTINPGGKLDIASSGDGDTLLKFSTFRPWAFQQEGTGQGIHLRLRNIGGGHKRFFIDTNGFTEFRTEDGSTTAVTIVHNGGSVTARKFIGAVNLNGNYLSGDGDTEGVFVDNDGNVGIGTAAPSAKFHVDAGDILIRRRGISSGASLTIEGRRHIDNNFAASLNFKNRDDDDSDTIYTAAAIRSHNSDESDDGDLRFFTASDLTLAESMRITGAGNVGIGTKTPGSELQVAGTVTATAFVGDGSGLTGISGDNLGSHTAAQALNLNGNYLSGDGDSEGVFVDNSGNVGIGTPAPGSELEVAGTVTATAFVGDGSGLTNLPPGDGWSLNGNSGTLDSVNFIGTTDNVALDFRVNNQRAFRFEPSISSPNIVGGFNGNTVSAGVNGATISGGGSGSGSINSVTADYGTVGGGRHNTASGLYATVPGGYLNIASSTFAVVAGGASNSASGLHSFVGGGVQNVASGLQATVPGGNLNVAKGANSFAAGSRAKALHEGAFVWADFTGANFTSSGDNQFLIRASGGVGINKNDPATALDVSGAITATDLRLPTSGIIYAADTLLMHTYGDGNVFTGKNAGNLTHNRAESNTGFGENALSGMVDGDNNTAVGFEALKANSHGETNTAVGNQALTLNTEGNSNTAIGGISMRANTYGEANTAIGSGSLNTNITGNFNTAIGVSSLHTNDTGSNNTAIGAGANVSTGGLQNATAIGAGAVVNASNKIKLGNNQVTHVSTTGTISAAAFVGDGSGLTGISGDDLGSHTATQTLNLNGNFLSGDGDDEGFFVDNGGNIGIGNSSPTSTLMIQDTANPVTATGMIDPSALAVKLKNPTDTDGNSTGIGFGINVVEAIGAAIVHEREAGSSRGKLHFGTRGEGGNNNPIPIHMTISKDGNVGIGTAAPVNGKLHVSGVGATQNLSYGFLNSSGNTGPGSGNVAYAIWADGRIAASEFNAHSDARIKHIQGLSDSKKDLQTLMDIKITDYTMIDIVAKGSQSSKKVIAQQVKSVFPQAVSTLTDVVPDIYKLSEIRDGWVQLATDLQVGEKVKLIRKDGNDIYAVLAVRDGAFRVDLATSGEVFVYGREVDDFHTVDYEAIAMLNVSATQALYQQLQQQQKEIEALKELREENKMLSTQLAVFEKRFAQVELALQGLNGGGAKAKLTSRK